MNQKNTITIESLDTAFKNHFDGEPEFIASAPGRVNLIGEHTDYNDGFVFPVAIDKYIHIAAQRRSDRKVHLHAMDIEEECIFSLDNIDKDDAPHWAKYIMGVAHFLQELIMQDNGQVLNGFSAVIAGDVPISAGLSSSAALEVASSYAVLAASGLSISITANHNVGKMKLIEIPPMKLAALCQRAENEFAGVNCGIMDQSISILGQADHALFLDCQTLDYKHIPLNLTNIKIVICNTNVKRELAASEYNKRRAECENGVNILKKWLPNITSLRDVTLDEYKKYEAELPIITQNRCRYVVEENTRVLNSVEALIEKDLETFGLLMNASHVGLRDLYEVSCDELDILTEIAQNTHGVLGARMTGAGFGGCTVNLVRTEAIDELRTCVLREYTKQTGINPDIYVCNVGDGAKINWLTDS